MPVPKKFYGDRPPAPGPRKMPARPTSKAASPPIVIDRHFRNGKYPDAGTLSMMNEQLNQAVVFRSKELFSAVTAASSYDIPLSVDTGDRERWRFAFHTGPYHHMLYARVIMHPPSAANADNIGYRSNTHARLDIRSGPLSSDPVIASMEFFYGAVPSGPTAFGWTCLRIVDKYIVGLAADTTYYATIVDGDCGRIHSMTAADLQSMTEGTDGYLSQNITPETPIVTTFREDFATILPPLWKRGGAKVFNWNAEPNEEPATIATSTVTNLIDGTSTTYGASIPGYQLDMTGKARLSQLTTGVPVRMRVYMDVPSGNTGAVTLRDSAGTSVIHVPQGGAYTGWVSGTGVLPASSAKYYLTHHRVGGTGTISIYAVSLEEYES